LIGEAWADLRDIVVPGGGQNDLWQTLNYKGKYAGEVRIEITYYDSRPKPDKPVAKARQVGSEQDGGSLSSRSPVKRRPLPSNPGLPDTASAPKARPEHAQIPPRPQPNLPVTSFIPNQSPLQAMEYNTPALTRFNPSDRYSPVPEHGSRYETPPSHRDGSQHHQSVERNDKFATYDDELHYNPEEQSRSYESDPRMAYNQSPQAYDSPPAAGHQQRQMIQDDDRPPPPPVHRVRNNSGNSLDMVNRSSLDMSPQGKGMSSMPMRHDVLRSEAHRHSVSTVSPLPASSSSNYPGRPIYRPYESAPNVPKELTYNDPNHSSPPRHHSYDASYDTHHRSMQPTVEDVPESWTPPNARSRHSTSRQEQHDDLGYGQVPSPAPLNLSGRGSAASGHFTPSPVQVQGRYGSNTYSATTSPGAPRDFSRSQNGHSYTGSFNFDDDPYSTHNNEMDNTQIRGSYALPPVPPTLVSGVDLDLSLEIASRFHEDRKHERRYTQPPSMPTPSRGRQHSEPPSTYAKPSPHGPHSVHSRNYGGSPITYSGSSGTPSGPVAISNPRRPSPSPNPNHTIKRKSVSPAPPQEARRLSGVPFGPDSYDAFNPSVASAKEETKRGEYTNAYGKIVTADGREVDPSDHLPMDTWAPEPEPKGPKQILAPEPGSRLPPSGRRQIRISTRPQSMAVIPATYINPGAEPSPPPNAGRNRLQKKSHRVSALPAPISGGSSPLGPATAHQRNSTPPRALVRASTFDYENYGPPYGGSPGAARGPVGNAPPVPAKLPLMSSGNPPPTKSFGGGVAGDEWAGLMEEMSRIDIGSGRARRHGGY
jgi:hypothetical protein